MQERAQLAAYAHIPIGNMGDDWMLAAADALYGRCCWSLSSCLGLQPYTGRSLLTHVC